jgi:hypothetical protein
MVHFHDSLLETRFLGESYTYGVVERQTKVTHYITVTIL